MSNQKDRTPPAVTRRVSRSPTSTGTTGGSALTTRPRPGTSPLTSTTERCRHVGDMDITLVDTYETRDPFALLDGQDAELGHVAGTLFDAGDGLVDPDLDEQLEPIGSRIPTRTR